MDTNRAQSDGKRPVIEDLSKDDAIARHNDMVKQLEESYSSNKGQFASRLYLASDMDSASVSRSVESIPLEPIYCRELKLNTSHSGRVLRGTLVVDAFCIDSVITILEDEVGDFVTVALYDAIQESLSGMLRLKAAQARFRKGSKIAILEPYYKVAFDGSYIVRIDNTSDLLFVTDLGPQDIAGLRVEGKKYFQERKFERAILCYKRCLKLSKDSALAALLLSNLAVALHSMAKAGDSLQCALSSVVLDGSRFKAYYFAGLALKELGRYDLANFCARKCRELGAPSNAQKTLAKDLSDRGNHISIEAFHEEVAMVLGNHNPLSLLERGVIANGGHDIDASCPITASTVIYRERGNVFFKEGNYCDAVSNYCKGLRCMEEVAILLNNIAACKARLEQHGDAVMYSQAAIAISPLNVKAHFRLISALLSLGLPVQAARSCEVGLSLIPGDPTLSLIRRERFPASFYRESTRHESSDESSDNGDAEDMWDFVGDDDNSEEDRSEKGADGNSDDNSDDSAETAEYERKPSTEDVIALNEMIEAVERVGGARAREFRSKGMVLDKRVAPFHQEFSREGNWPASCDRAECMKMLTEAFEHARGPNFEKQCILSTDSLMFPGKFATMRRLGSNCTQVLQWWMNADIPSLSPRPRPECPDYILRSFSSVPVRSLTLTKGTVHVAVAFEDMSTLLFSKLKESKEKRGPLRWIGYEASPHCVAKTLVLAQMFRRQAHTDDILQVWFSAAWSIRALRAFSDALSDVLKEENYAQRCLHEEVHEYLTHWQKHKVSLLLARKVWLKLHNSHAQSFVANFKNKRDRLAVSEYIMSGQLLKGEVGSVTMFSIPPCECGHMHSKTADDECFLQCLLTTDLNEEWRKSASIVAAGLDLLRGHISAMKKNIAERKVHIEVHCRAVTPENHELHSEIRALEPFTVSWNNIIDYMPNNDFHKMARSCSADRGTTHSLCSVHWRTEVNGAFLLDYPDPQNREFSFDMSKRVIDEQYRRTGVSNLLHSPPIADSMHFTDYMLSSSGVYTAWVDAFYDAAKLCNSAAQVATVQTSIYNVMWMNPVVLFLAYSYDEGVTFPTREV